MPGRQSYGPGGKWIHDRAKRIQRKNPEMGERVAFAVATQQAHKVGKSPKKFRTSAGVREAKMKFSLPKKEYQKTAMLCGLFDELEGIDKEAGALRKSILGLGAALALSPAMARMAPKAVAGTAGKAAITSVAKKAPMAVGSSRMSAPVRKAMGEGRW